MVKIKIAIIYTATTPQMIGLIEEELKLAVSQTDLKILTYTDPSVLSEIVENSNLTPSAAKRLMKMYMDAVSAGAEIVYSICSSVGDLADEAQGVFEMMGVPLIRVDTEMMLQGINIGKTIGVLATLKSTLEPTKSHLKRCASQNGMEVTIIDALAEGAFGKPQQELEQMLIDKACSIADQVDVIILAQSSMAMCQDRIALATGKPVLSSPKSGAVSIARAVKKLTGGGKENENN